MQELQTLLASAEQRAERAITASNARVAASPALEANTEAEAEKQGGGQAAKVAGKDQLTALTTTAAAATTTTTKPGAEYQAQEHGEDKGESDEEDEEEVSLSAEESRAWDRKDLFRWLENRQQGELCDAIIEAFDKTNFDSAEWVDTLVGEPFALCSPSPVATRALLLITAGVLRVLSPWPEFQQMQLG